ncbi:hypothetical protein SCG7086_BY_00100 [Chlamydiales bacterium SCGC AG-110-P3]|nr:hypothetical protein SCG7086_BY_00100 [Chlamydiales bacterium SCGC AG-110-P3]
METDIVLSTDDTDNQMIQWNDTWDDHTFDSEFELLGALQDTYPGFLPFG